MKYFYGKEAYYTRSASIIITFGVVRNVWCYLFQTVVIVTTQRHLGIVGLSLLHRQGSFLPL